MSKALDTLLSSTKWRTGVAVAKRLPPKTTKAIQSDLRKVVDVENAGKPIPKRSDLTAYVNSEYGLAVSHTTVFKWLDQVRKGQPIS